jgi:hypothetical protein
MSIATTVLGVLLLMVTGCGNLDPYAEKFPRVNIGDDSQHVIETMGNRPDVVNSVEVPVMKAEQWAWRAPGIRGRIYIVLLVMDHTVAKASVD